MGITQFLHNLCNCQADSLESTQTEQLARPTLKVLPTAHN